jgi:hypothetical protein
MLKLDIASRQEALIKSPAKEIAIFLPVMILTITLPARAPGREDRSGHPMACKGSG